MKNKYLLDERAEILNRSNPVILNQDARTKQIEDEGRRQEVKKIALQNDVTKQQLIFRRSNLSWLKKLTRRYLEVVGIFLLLSGIANFFSKTFLEPSVLVTLLGTTTATIVGLMAIAVGSFFPKK